MNVVDLYSPLDVPFGQLSNNYVQYLRVGNLQYPTPTNYILSSMIDDPIDKSILRRAKIQGNRPARFPPHLMSDIFARLLDKQQTWKNRIFTNDEKNHLFDAIRREIATFGFDIYDLYNSMRDQAVRDQYANVVREIYETVIRSNTELKTALVALGNVQFVYRSSNTNLGVNEKHEGINIVGRAIGEIQRTLVSEARAVKEQAEREALIEYARKFYSVKQYIEMKVRKGENLNEFLQQNIEQIFNTLPPAYIINEDDFKRYPVNVDEIATEKTRPKSLVKRLIASNVEQIEKKRHNIVFQWYVQFVFRPGLTKFSDVVDDEDVDYNITDETKQYIEQIKKAAPESKDFEQLKSEVYSA